MFKRALYALTGLVLTGVVALGAVAPITLPYFTGAQDPSQIFYYLNTLIQELNAQSINNINFDYNNPRNLLDNGQMQVQQRGTTTKTCGTTTIPSSAYGADRWGCNVNVGSGAGTLQVITTSLPASPVFNAGMTFYRTSGSLAQPQCVMQEIPTSRITPLQNQSVTLSFYAEGLANMLAETTTLNAYLFTGTGTDQGLQSFTASPAITPAFAGIASTQTAAFTLTSAYQRFSTTFAVGSTVTEAALALCWTPTVGGTSGTTDGFNFTGVQLELGVAASQFEYRPYQAELLSAQAFYYQINESATAATARGSCTNLTSSISNCIVPFPVTMFKVPTMAYTTGFAIAVAAQTSMGNCTANATSTTATSAAGTGAVLMSCATSAAGGALGTSTTWGDGTGTGQIRASADF